MKPGIGVAEKIGGGGRGGAILLLNCYRNAVHEARAKAIIAAKNPKCS